MRRSNVLFEPRTLSLAHAATTNGIPIVLANLVTDKDEHQETAYKFEVAQEVSVSVFALWPTKLNAHGLT
jgi:hypothetical protein